MKLSLREFDVISDEFIGEAKPSGQSLSKAFRNQAKEVFDAAKQTNRKVYYQFSGAPSNGVTQKLKEYSLRYGVELIIDIL